MNTIAEQWQIFDSVVVPKKATDIQRESMKLAFYSGAEAMLRIMCNVGGDDLSEDGGVAILAGCSAECQRFSREYGEKRGLPQVLVDAISPQENHGKAS